MCDARACAWWACGFAPACAHPAQLDPPCRIGVIPPSGRRRACGRHHRTTCCHRRSRRVGAAAGATASPGPSLRLWRHAGEVIVAGARRRAAARRVRGGGALRAPHQSFLDCPPLLVVEGRERLLVLLLLGGRHARLGRHGRLAGRRGGHRGRRHRGIVDDALQSLPEALAENSTRRIKVKHGPKLRFWAPALVDANKTDRFLS